MSDATGKLPVLYHRHEICRFVRNGKEYPVAQRRLHTSLVFERKHQGPIVLSALLDTGAPLCVIPRKTVQRVGLKCDRLNWSHWNQSHPSTKTYAPQWCGVDCELGCVRVWYRPFLQADSRGPFDMVAKLPKSDPPGFSLDYDMLLGLNFLSEHWCDAKLQCHTEQHAGTIEFP